MSRIESILAHKGAQVVTAEPTGTAMDAAMVMNGHRASGSHSTKAG